MSKRYKMCRHLGPRVGGGTCTDCTRTCLKGLGTNGKARLSEECQTCTGYEVKVKAQFLRKRAPLPVVEVDHPSDLESGVVGDDHDLKVQVGGEGE